MLRSQQFIAVLEDKINTSKLTQIWKTLQSSLGVENIELRLDSIGRSEREMLDQIIPNKQIDGSSNSCVLSIQTMEGKIEQIKKILSQTECKLLKLIKIPKSFGKLQNEIPSNIMRDQF